MNCVDETEDIILVNFAFNLIIQLLIHFEFYLFTHAVSGKDNFYFKLNKRKKLLSKYLCKCFNSLMYSNILIYLFKLQSKNMVRWLFGNLSSLYLRDKQHFFENIEMSY